MHRWINNKCQKCGVRRKIKERAKFVKGYYFKGDFVKAKRISFDKYDYAKNGKIINNECVSTSFKKYGSMENQIELNLGKI